MAATMAASLFKPAYDLRFTNEASNQAQRTATEDTAGPLPAIKLAIPKTTFTAPKNGLPVNPSPYTSLVDPAIQFPTTGRTSPSLLDRRRSPEMIQNEFISPRAASPQRAAASTQDKATQTDSRELSRSSSHASLHGCQYCHGCQRRLGHARSNSSTSSASSTTSVSASPEISSPETTTNLSRRPSSAFGKKFKFNLLQRSSSMPARADRDGAVKAARKQSVSRATPVKRIAFELIDTEEHWAD